MKKILLLSDTHACVEADIIKHFDEVDELWHAGDWVNSELSNIMASTGKTVKGVWGNADGQDIRALYPLDNIFDCEDVRVWMTHIGGYPGKYEHRVLKGLKHHSPDLFICGHSHILKVMRDKEFGGMLYMNPGAAGRHGFHFMRTMLKFEISRKEIKNVAVIELGKRTAGILPDLQ